MAIQDEIREEQKKVKDMSFSGKIHYIWDYYKIHIMVGLLILIFGIVFVKDWVRGSRPDYLNAVVLNTVLSYEKDSDIVSDYIDFAKVDAKAYNVKIDTTLQIDLENNTQMGMASEQKILVLFSSGELDVMMAPEAVADFYATENAFTDIRSLLTQEQLKRLEDSGYPLYYATCEGKTVPVGFYVGASEYLKTLSENGTFIPEDNPVFAVTSCMQHPEAVVQLMQMITGES